MSKKEFLNKLAKKLSVLEENERQDIISEYTDTINEKVKKGQTEEDAVKDFGDIDDLVKEILKAYKINPDFDDEEPVNDNILKQGASVIADWSHKIANRFKNANNNINLAFIIEIIIRIFIVLILMLILSGVMNLFGSIGYSMIENIAYPFGNLINIVWKLCLVVLFIILSVLLVIAMFKNYFVSSDNEVSVETKKEEVKPKSDLLKQNNTKVEKQNQQKSGSTLGDVCLLIVKIFVVLWVIIPMIIFDCFAVFGLIVSIIYLIEGINLIGLVLLMLGGASLLTYIIILLFKLLFGNGKISVIPPIVSIIVAIIGLVLFINMIMNIDYIDESPTDIKQEVETKTFNTTSDILIHYSDYYSYDSDIKKEIDNNMKDGEVKLEVTYNNEYQNVDFIIDENHVQYRCDDDYYDDDYYDYEDYEDYEHHNCPSKNYYLINVDVESSYDEFKEFKQNYKFFIDNLKNNKIYNHSKLYYGQLKITANENTLKRINIE